MTQHPFLLFPLAVSISGLAAAQTGAAGRGSFLGTNGLMTVDAATGAPDALLIKQSGFTTSPPTELQQQTERPDLRGQAVLYSHTPAPTGPLEIDAFSMGLDWIVSDATGIAFLPAGRWAGLLFSVTRGSTGLAGTAVNDEYLQADGAAGDIFAYEFYGDGSGNPASESLYRATDSREIALVPPSGTPDIRAFDLFAADYIQSDLQEKLPEGPTVYFSVTTATASNVPLQWCGNSLANRSGATIFKTTWSPRLPGHWSTPTVYLTPKQLQLTSGDDVDALAVDTTHYGSHYALFSTANPGPTTPRIQFFNRSTGLVATYRFATAGTVESRIGIDGVLGTGDIDSLCSSDPEAYERFHPFAARPVDLTAGYPSPPNWPIGSAQLSNLPCTVYRQPGSPYLHVYSASDLHLQPHRFWVLTPDSPGSPPLGPFSMSRSPTWSGWPSAGLYPMSSLQQDQRLQFGVEEQQPGGQWIASPLMEITEWAEHGPKVAAPSMFAAAEGAGSSQNVWRNTPNRVQCFYDTSHFTDQGVQAPMLIDELEWRIAGNAVTNQVVYQYVNLYLGYSQYDHASPDTIFANNRTGSHTLVYGGPVVVQKAWGVTPNRYSIRVPLQTPFLYDPTLGQDLLVEIEIQQAPSPTTPSTVSTALTVALHRANTVRSLGTTGASMGMQSAFCPVCRFGYTVPANAATTRPYGKGCYDERASFYEQFPPNSFDLSGAPVHSIRLTPSNGAYTISQGSNAWNGSAGTTHTLTDDSTVLVSLPSQFVSPAGATNQITICSNGFITLNSATITPAFLPTTSALLTGQPRICVGWTDLDPSAGGTVRSFTTSSTCVVTWDNVPTYQSGGYATMQIELDLTTGPTAGTVELRWQNCSFDWPAMVGWSPGVNAADPGDRDLGDLPFVTRPDRNAMQLSGSPRAVVGTTTTYAAMDVHPAALVTVQILNIGGVDPGVDLGPFGMPECGLYVNLPWILLLAMSGSPTATAQLSIPSGSSWLGLEIDSQALSLVPGINNLGAVVSNGLTMTVGSL